MIDFKWRVFNDVRMNEISALRRCQELLIDNDLLVLATTGPQGPHTSLMAYVASDDGREVYLATSRKSRKWSNILTDPRVSLLIDDRVRQFEQGRETISALTLSGVHAPVTDERDAKRVRQLLLQRHPQLEAFLGNPEGQLVRIWVQSVLLLSGFNDAFRYSYPS